MVCSCRQQQKRLLVLSWPILSSPVPSMEGTLGGTSGTQPFRRRRVFSTEELFCQSRRETFGCLAKAVVLILLLRLWMSKDELRAGPALLGQTACHTGAWAAWALRVLSEGRGGAEESPFGFFSFFPSILYLSCPLHTSRVLLLPPLLPVSAVLS